MKTLHIPYLDIPNTADADKVSAILNSQGARLDIDTVNWPDSYPDNRQTTVSAAHTLHYLYLEFTCNGNDLQALVDTDQGPVSSDSCVEFFVSPDPASPRYWNFEFNAIGRINASTRVLRPEPTRLSSQQLRSIATYPSAGRQPFSNRPGVHTWTLLVRIPLQLIGIGSDKFPTTMLGNFYKCGSGTPSPHYLSWSPIQSPKPNFHVTDSFATIILD